MTEKLLGKIEKVYFGDGGYQGAQFGLTLCFYMSGSGITAFVNGGWKERPESAQWTEQDRAIQQSNLCMKIIEILKKAKVDDVYKLKNIPVEVIVENGCLISWRVLEEVL